MTETNDTTNAQSQHDNTSRVPYVKAPIKTRVHNYLQKLFNRKPAYRVTRNGVEVSWFDFSNTDELPFDQETYAETQLFLGKWCNPWYVDLDEIEENYDDFTDEDITEIDDVIENDHIYPSQRYKIVANQKVTEQMFLGGTLSGDTTQRLLYAVIAGLIILGLIIIFGG